MARRRSRPVPGQRWSRQVVDDWFPTLVRYGGLVLMFYWVFIDHLQHVALFTAATGMIVFKSVYGGGERE